MVDNDSKPIGVKEEHKILELDEINKIVSSNSNVSNGFSLPCM